jgi:hypothetical protein
MTRLVDSTAISLLAFSLLGLAINIVLVHLPSTTQDAFVLRRPMVGVVFSAVCILGIVAAVYPSKCSAVFHFKETRRGRPGGDSSDARVEELRLRGHHPNCGKFSAHVFKTGRRVFCAGCVGLLLGAVLSLIGVTRYFFFNLPFSQTYWLFWIGCVGVMSGLLQYHLFNWGKSSIHLLVNTYFVFGVFLMLAAADQIAQSTTISLYIVVLSIFWLYTRITLSKLDHTTLCNACPVESCEFTYRKSVEKG